jgi:hypothetical protein
MDWAGQGLRSLIQKQQPLGEDAARYVAFQLADSLAHLHSKVSTAAAAHCTHWTLRPDAVVLLS